MLTYVKKYAEYGYTNRLAQNLQKIQVFGKFQFYIFRIFFIFCNFVGALIYTRY